MRIEHWERVEQHEPDRQSAWHQVSCGARLGCCPPTLVMFHDVLSSSLNFWGKFLQVASVGRWQSAALAQSFRHGDFNGPVTVTGHHPNEALAFTLFLTKGWDRHRGGSFWWFKNSPAQRYDADFNALFLFRGDPASLHMVAPVVAHQPGHFMISGWFVFSA